jgi:hypothetical protein
MISTTWTDALAGNAAMGLDVRPRAERRAPEAFTAPYQGTGLPSGASGPSRCTDKFHTDTPLTTLGIHSSRRPPG